MNFNIYVYSEKLFLWIIEAKFIHKVRVPHLCFKGLSLLNRMIFANIENGCGLFFNQLNQEKFDGAL